MALDPFSTVWLILRDVCLPILVVIGLGWTFDKRFKLDLETLVKLNIYLFVPAFIFVRVTESEIATAQGFRIVGFTVAMITSMALLSLTLGKLRNYPPEHKQTLLLTSMFYNCGNFGLPLTALAFPNVGPGIQVFVLMTMNVATFSVGLMLATAKTCPKNKTFRLNFGPVLRQPSIYAILLAIVLKMSSVPVEEIVFLWKPAEFLADALVGLALITLGVQLSKTKRAIFHGPLAWALTIRLIAGPVCAILLSKLFGFQAAVAAVLVLGAAAPTAVNTALLAHEFNADSQTASAAVLYSTVLSFIPIAIILLWIRLYWPI
jgi:predicted permease